MNKTSHVPLIGINGKLGASFWLEPNCTLPGGTHIRESNSRGTCYIAIGNTPFEYSVTNHVLEINTGEVMHLSALKQPLFVGAWGDYVD